MEWQGEPLVSLEFMKNKIEATKTRTGLAVSAKIINKTDDDTKENKPDDGIEEVNLTREEENQKDPGVTGMITSNPVDLTIAIWIITIIAAVALRIIMRRI